MMNRFLGFAAGLAAIAALAFVGQGPPAAAQTPAAAPLAIIQTSSSQGFALTTNPLSQFAATTSAQLAATISDESGTAGTLPFQSALTTWTPIDTSGASLVFTNVSASYYAIGNMVFVQWDLRYPVTASGASSMIGGLPFTAAAASAMTPEYSPVSPTWLFVSGAGTTIRPVGIGGAALTNAQLSNAFLGGAGFYFR